MQQLKDLDSGECYMWDQETHGYIIREKPSVRHRRLGLKINLRWQPQTRWDGE